MKENVTTVFFLSSYQTRKFFLLQPKIDIFVCALGTVLIGNKTNKTLTFNNIVVKLLVSRVVDPDLGTKLLDPGLFEGSDPDPGFF